VINVKDGATWKVPTPYIKVGATWLLPSEVWVNESGIWKKVWPEPTNDGGQGGDGGGGIDPLSLQLDTTFAFANARNSTLTSSLVTGTAAGGTEAYTYLWEISTSDGVTITNPTERTTAFRKVGAVIDEHYYATATLKVTDSLGAIVISQVVTIQLYRPPPLPTGGYYDLGTSQV
jgi:hypothetical protein